jgi:hypothetical protein
MRTRHRWPGTVRAVAAVAAGVRAFSDELVQMADGVLGPSQWEPGMTFPNIVGPTSDWFLDSFQKQCDRPPDYMAAGSFATGLVLAECIRLAASLDDEKLRNTASDLDCNTFYQVKRNACGGKRKQRPACSLNFVLLPNCLRTAHNQTASDWGNVAFCWKPRF